MIVYLSKNYHLLCNIILWNCSQYFVTRVESRFAAGHQNTPDMIHSWSQNDDGESFKKPGVRNVVERAVTAPSKKK